MEVATQIKLDGIKGLAKSLKKFFFIFKDNHDT
jgi:hypothetical protein